MAEPRIFISHSETNFSPTDYAIRIIDLLGCIPVIAEQQPKLSRPVQNLVCDTMDSCDAAIVIATPDRDGPYGKEPSQGVLWEMGRLKDHPKLKNRYIIIKEKSVSLGPMIPAATYEFEDGNYSPIAEAILIELNSMGLFSNYYSLPGSDIKELQTLMEIFSKLRDLIKKRIITKDMVEKIAQNMTKNIIESFFREVE